MWVLFSLFFLLTNIVCGRENIPFVDLECPDHFYIKQYFDMRAFQIVNEADTMGVILNSDFGVLDFYDRENNQQWTNRFDSLYDNLDHCIGYVKLASDTEWFWERRSVFSLSTHIEIFSGNNELLATVEQEGDGKCFVFREAESGKPLAIALWSWVPTGTNYFSWLDYYAQSWEVMVIDRSLLQQKKIPNIYLIWALLKHSQKHFPEITRFPHQQSLPKK